MAAPSKAWTREEVLAMQDAAPNGVRYELIDGELLVSPSPNHPHQRCIAALMVLLYLYSKRHRIGWVMTSPADINLDGASTLQPDIFVVPWATTPERRGWDNVTKLLLAAEVLSPSTARGDRTVKRRYLQRQAVPAYWIVDVDARLVERWTPGDDRPELVTDVLTWQPAPEIEPLVIDLVALFAESTGE